MTIQEAWDKALKNTEIIRPRVQPLRTHDVTHLPYIFLSESSFNQQDTVVRKGEILVEKPAIIMPYQNMPQFEGFKFDEEMKFDEDLLKSFFLVRGFSLPSLKYNNASNRLDIHEGKLSQAVTFYLESLQKDENVHTGLIVGPQDCWQFCVLFFICGQIVRSANSDIQKLFDDHRKRSN